VTASSIDDSHPTSSFSLYQEVVPMIRLRQCSVLIFAILVAPTLRAQDKPAAPDKPASPWVIDRALTVSPRSAPVPALKYRVLPLTWDLKDGNAVPIYLRLTHEQNDAARKYLTEPPKEWNLMPVDKVPLDEAHKFLQKHRYMLRQLELGARRRTVDWSYTLDEPNPIGLLLPDVQVMRNYAPILILQARVALAEGDFTAAAHHLETGFAFSRHVADGPTLIHKLVGFAIASEFAGVVADFMERTDSPNLYWALTALPRPLIDLRVPLEWEYRMLEMQFPELNDLDRERTPEQWDVILQRVRTELRHLDEGAEAGKPRHLEWYPKDCAPGDAAAKSPELPAARKYVARTKGLPADKVEAMPPAQVLLLAMMGTYREDCDDWYRGAYLPYPQARPLLETAHKRLRDAPISEGHVPARLILPGLDRVLARQARSERTVAALRIIEALRMYAAAHDGKLPEKLDDVTEAPIPNDPGTDRPFEYSREGDTATLVSQVPGDSQPNNGLRYRVTIRKK
jgi:hypothetical protein